MKTERVTIMLDLVDHQRPIRHPHGDNIAMAESIRNIRATALADSNLPVDCQSVCEVAHRVAPKLLVGRRPRINVKKDLVRIYETVVETEMDWAGRRARDGLKDGLLILSQESYCGQIRFGMDGQVYKSLTLGRQSVTNITRNTTTGVICARNDLIQTIGRNTLCAAVLTAYGNENKKRDPKNSFVQSSWIHCNRSKPTVQVSPCLGGLNGCEQLPRLWLFVTFFPQILDKLLRPIGLNTVSPFVDG